MSVEPRRHHYVAVFVVSMALLMLEITFARILSVALVSHFAFVAISLAMFGLGLSGLAVYLFPAHFRADRLDRQLVRYSWLFGVAAAASLILFLHVQVVQQLSLRGFLQLSLVYVVLAVPFFLGGTCISLLMTHCAQRIGRIYAADLGGASLGCLGAVAAMETASAPMVVALVGAAATVLSVYLATRTEPRRFASPVGALVLLLVVLALGARTDLLRVLYVKGGKQDYTTLERWNSFSRVTVFPSPELNAAQFVPLEKPFAQYAGDQYPRTMVLDIDGTAWTPLTNFKGDFSRLDYLRDSVLYVAHHLRPSANVLVIGAGAGRDLLAAKVFGQRSILGLELNPLIEHIVQEDYADYSGRPYTLPGVRVIIDEARSRLSRLDEKFDIIQLSLIDTFSLNAAGGIIFTENYLYTKEGFQEYFRHLAPDGILSVTRYFAPAYPFELLRLAGLARAAWQAEGVEKPADHIVALGQGLHFSILAKRAPFTPQELQHLREVAAAQNMQVLYQPGMDGPGFASLGTLLTTDDFRGFVDTYPFLIGPPTDDEPFFFHLLRGRLAPGDIPDTQGDPFQFLRLWNEAVSLLYLLVVAVSTMAAVFFLGPLLWARRGESLSVPPTIVLPLLVYFACLGYGFMMVEIPLLQRFILFLGYPVYALAVVLFSLLLFTGLGSLLSTRFDSEPRRALTGILTAVVLMTIGYLYLTPPVIRALLGFPTIVRIITTVLLLAPLGLLLGMAYPLGITVLRGYAEQLVPWAWGINGALSVVASVFAIFIGSRFGFSTAFLTGIAAYGVALLVMAVLPRVAAPAEAVEGGESA